LFAKGDVCICDKFVDKGSKMPPKKDGRLPKRVKKEVEVLTTGELNSYIQTLARI